MIESVTKKNMKEIKTREGCKKINMNDNLCEECKYAENDSNKKPCSSCLHWVDGYLTALNFVNKYLDADINVPTN